MDLEALFIPMVLTIMGSFAVVLGGVALFSRDTPPRRRR